MTREGKDEDRRDDAAAARALQEQAPGHQDGEEADLQAVRTEGEEREATRVRALDAGHRPEPARAAQDREIDAMLASGDFLGLRDQRDDPEVIAFRVMGWSFQRDPDAESRDIVLAQLRRIRPGRTDQDYERLFQAALDRWTEAYGY
jgi:hypothetical protein